MSQQDSAGQSGGAEGRLGLQVLAAGIVGTGLAILVVLPAEYGLDLTGFGALTGLVTLSRPAEVVVETRFVAPPEIARPEPVPFRQDVVTIPVGAFGASLGATEYKVTLEEGQTLLYSWKATTPLLFEFHGHTTPTDGSPAEVMDYIKGQADEGHGTLTAPLSGIHGWYFANSTFAPVTVELTMAGYYKLEPGLIGIH